MAVNECAALCCGDTRLLVIELTYSSACLYNLLFSVGANGFLYTSSRSKPKDSNRIQTEDELARAQCFKAVVATFVLSVSMLS